MRPETPDSHPKRPCPVCLGKESKLLFQQTFATLSESSLMDGYDVVICRNCGGCYADHIPPQEIFDRYYAEMSKYTHGDRDGKISETDAARFRQIVDAVSPYVEKHESIVDVGCATGGLLAEFKRRGHQNLIGFEPSPACAETARRLYDLEVRPVGISSLDQAAERFDLVILTVVLEHVCDLDSSLVSLTKLLKPGGRLYLEVPDAGAYYQWFSAPFQFFSMEHINFFSKESLANLLARHGFSCAFANTVTRYGSPKSVEPAVSALFSHTGKPGPIIYDDVTEPALRKYIENSQTLETRINAVIENLAISREPLAVWAPAPIPCACSKLPRWPARTLSPSSIPIPPTRAKRFATFPSSPPAGSPGPMRRSSSHPTSLSRKSATKSKTSSGGRTKLSASMKMRPPDWIRRLLPAKALAGRR